MGYGEMAMKCPSCGRETQNDAAFCAVCGSRISRTYAQIAPAIQRPPNEAKKRHEMLLVVAVIIIVIVAIVAVIAAVDLGLFSGSQFSADLHYTASQGYPGIYVDVWGYVYNNGITDAVAILHLRIFDGSDWHSYEENVGAIASEGHRYIELSITLPHGDADAVTIRHSFTAG